MEDFHRESTFAEGSKRRKLLNWVLSHKVGDTISLKQVYDEYNNYGNCSMNTIKNIWKVILLEFRNQRLGSIQPLKTKPITWKIISMNK